MSLLAFTKDEALRFVVFHGDSLIDQDVDPLKVFEEPEYIDAFAPILVENWRVDAIVKNGSDVFIYNHIYIVIHSLSASSKKLVTGCKNRHSCYEPAISQCSLDTVI